MKAAAMPVLVTEASIVVLMVLVTTVGAAVMATMVVVALLVTDICGDVGSLGNSWRQQ